MNDAVIMETEARETACRRPTLVSLAATMLAAGGALFAGEVLLSADKYFTGMSVYEQAVADGVIKNEGAFAGIGVVLHGFPALVGVAMGCTLALLAIFTAFGHNWARAVAWILGVPILIWYGVLAILYFASLSFLDPGSVDYSVPSEVTRRYEQAWPSWLDTVDTVLMIVVPLVLLVALVCQTVPISDAYFRLRRERRIA